jgi:16S rRNA (cytosine1402-N4)-methyltransferase
MHKPVLLKEVITTLDIQSSDKVVDGTLGGGGYFREICKLVGKEGLVIGLDQDDSVIQKMEETISQLDNQCEIKLINENFRYLDKVLSSLNIENVDKIVFDLGISSDQLDDSGRGFSFQRDESLFMTLKKNLTENDLTAQEIVNDWEKSSLIDIISGYGEERFTRKIVDGIVEARKQKRIETTFELVEIIKKSVPNWYQSQKIHFATKTFQALRIAVNDEILSLQDGLEKGWDCLSQKGRMVVVSFHSKEDRVVKRFFKDKKLKQAGILIVKKPIVPTRDEVKDNSRSRSAKLRVIEKL